MALINISVDWSWVDLIKELQKYHNITICKNPLRVIWFDYYLFSFKVFFIERKMSTYQLDKNHSWRMRTGVQCNCSYRLRLAFGARVSQVRLFLILCRLYGSTEKHKSQFINLYTTVFCWFTYRKFVAYTK